MAVRVLRRHLRQLRQLRQCLVPVKALPAGTQYWKYGPTAADPSPHWYTLSATVAGNVITFQTYGIVPTNKVEASNRATVLEVEGLDRPGFLYDVTQAIFESGLSISSAIIATYGERASDVFYVRDGFGHKVTHPERLKTIHARLIKALEGEPVEALVHTS
jgi:hypothetical protein